MVRVHIALQRSLRRSNSWTRHLNVKILHNFSLERTPTHCLVCMPTSFIKGIQILIVLTSVVKLLNLLRLLVSCLAGDDQRLVLIKAQIIIFALLGAYLGIV